MSAATASDLAAEEAAPTTAVAATDACDDEVVGGRSTPTRRGAVSSIRCFCKPTRSRST